MPCLRPRTNHLAILLVTLALSACALMEDETPEAHVSGLGQNSLVPSAAPLASAIPEGQAAYEYYLKILDRDPKDGAARAALSEILEKRGDLAGAEAQINHALASDPGNADWHRAKGKIHVKQAKYEAARASFAQAVERAPNDVRALNGLGVSLDHLGRHAAAQIIYRRALENKPEDYASLSNLGRSLALSGDYSGAIALLEPYAMRKDAPSTMRHNLAESYALSGMPLDAQRVLRIDQTREQVAQTLAGYKRRNGGLKLAQAPSVNLGRYPTMAMAEAKLEQIRAKATPSASGVVLTVLPVIDEAGGTPKFVIHGTGFANLIKARAYCEGMRAHGTSCALRSGREK